MTQSCRGFSVHIGSPCCLPSVTIVPVGMHTKTLTLPCFSPAHQLNWVQERCCCSQRLVIGDIERLLAHDFSWKAFCSFISFAGQDSRDRCRIYRPWMKLAFSFTLLQMLAEIKLIIAIILPLSSDFLSWLCKTDLFCLIWNNLIFIQVSLSFWPWPSKCNYAHIFFDKC